MDTATTLQIERHAGALVVRLARPDVYNAMNAAMLSELRGVAAAISLDESVRVVVLTGIGRAFSAGADLAPGAFPVIPGEARGAMTRRLLVDHFNPAVMAWAALPQPLLVAVNGVAAGGGVGLALLGDIIIGSRTATFQNVFLPRLALLPDLASGWHMERLIGPGRSLALAMLGEPLTSDRAAEWGLIWDSVDEGSLEGRVMDLARRLESGPSRALQLAKASVRGSKLSALGDRLSWEADLQGELADEPDHAEGVAAFLEKRIPRFR